MILLAAGAMTGAFFFKEWNASAAHSSPLFQQLSAIKHSREIVVSRELHYFFDNAIFSISRLFRHRLPPIQKPYCERQGGFSHTATIEFFMNTKCRPKYVENNNACEIFFSTKAFWTIHSRKPRRHMFFHFSNVVHCSNVHCCSISVYLT